MSWIHVNKYGVNEVFDSGQVRFVGFIKEPDNKFAVEILYKDGISRLLSSEQLIRSAEKCHELVRDIGNALKAATITGLKLETPK